MTTPVAKAAFMYACLLERHGVGRHSPHDREAVDLLLARYPTVRNGARSTRGFLLRTARAMAENGMDQFLELGCGLPVEPNVHDVVHEVRPEARVVYVDNEPTVVSYGDAMLRGPGITVVEGDVRDLPAILDHPQVRDTLDFERPIGVLMVGLLHFVADPAPILARLRQVLAPGSHLAIGHACSSTMPADEVAVGKRVYEQTRNPVFPRTTEEIGDMFDGWQLLEPGLVLLPDWRPYGGDPYPEKAIEGMGGVGVLTASFPTA
ncbi:SAM-dependent methyltransferase [Streptosporangium sp. NPDC020072]|uniref:SAM-dependent methyltransferase n=1 Tax=Streptosporangium sp. NPDC020072 TaxID=3154788 RepID=UPI003424E767